jgi:LPXTG-motif cell wall-anchored protein
MDGSRARRRTRATAAAALTVLALAPLPAALAQSAGDEQYADPLAGGGQPEQQQPRSQPDGASGGDSGASAPSSPAPAPPAPDATATDTAGELSAPTAATLPRTGADAGLQLAAGLALAAVGALSLARLRRVRHARD